MEHLCDQTASLQVLGCILQSPMLLSETDKYRLTIDDFESRLTKSIFGAIYNLYQGGAASLTEIDIDLYLSNKPGIYEEFTKRNGVELLQDAREIAQEGNFPYYYNRVKKFSALRALKQSGFDISDIYDSSLLGTEKMSDQDKSLDDMSIQDIFQKIQRKYIVVEQQYSAGGSEGSISASDGLFDLKERYKAAPEVGSSFQNNIFNTVVRGARKGKFYLDAGASGSGKSRKMAGHAAFLAYPYRFNDRTAEWEFTGNCEQVLIVTTELEKEEVQSLLLSAVSGINEEIIIQGTYTQEEEAIVDMAIKIMEYYKDNLRIEQIPNPTRSAVISSIRRHNIMYGTSYVFYDYIFSSPGLLNEYRDLKVREDVVLMMMSTALKDVAVELNVFVWSATQLSGEYEGKKGIRNQAFLRGAKSIADKVDVGMITLPVNQDELTALQSKIQNLGCIPPTHVTDMYKVRRGRYNEVKIWSYHDLGTCRFTDLFITDAYFNDINDFQTRNYVLEKEGYDIPNIEDIIGTEALQLTSTIKPQIDIEAAITPKVIKKPTGDWGDLIS